MRARIPSLLLIAALSGCAVNYKGPVHQDTDARQQVNANASEILNASKRVLVSEGFQIVSYDNEAGVISTAPKNMRLGPRQADCGTTMGLNYLEDNRTSTQVALGVIAKDGGVIVKSTISGDYRPGDVSQNMTLTCVSLGEIEAQIIADIGASLK